ncbi:MAG: 2-C-methyl-D-erythritol 2,4-cyclodiphosphate synthase, partial [Planctomycetota bacterium]
HRDDFAAKRHRAAGLDAVHVVADLTQLRIGHGHDVHRIQAGGTMTLGGEVVAMDRSFVAHSDGDVLYHAVVDALLGALGEGDIGRHFANDDARWKDADSLTFLRHAAELVRSRGLGVVNLDATILAEAPKLAPHVDAMAGNLVRELGGQANVKAGTNEGTDAVGRGECIIATAVVLLAPITPTSGRS